MRDLKEILPRTLAVVEQSRAAGRHLGIQLYLSRRGETMADFALGENQPGLPLQTDTVMLWYSSTKPVTAVAIAQLWEQGKLGLDDPVCRHLPEFGNQGKEAITLRHLLTHTGGFRSADKLPEDLPWDETIRRICEAPLEADWAPGQKAGYHATSSWFLLGEIVRRIAGRPLDQYVREHIYAPLGMNDSWLGIPPEVYRRYGDRIGIMYWTQRGEVRPHSFWNTERGCALVRPGSNGRGPIRELGRFYEALLAGWDPGRAGKTPALLKPETIRAFTTRQRVGMFDHTFQHVVDCGLGFIISSNRYGRETVPYGYGRHASEETFGHSGSQSSAAFADPAHGLVVAWVFNGMPGERAHQKRARELNTAIYEDLGVGEGGRENALFR